MTDVAANLAAIRARIAVACARAGRDPGSVTLIAVSKVQPLEKLRAALGAGQRVFGENYAQELRDKADALRGELGSLASPEWHFIGALQTNKVKYVVGRAALVHTVDRASLANELGKRAAALGAVQRVLVEVNVGEEPQKSGALPADLGPLLDAIRAQPALRLEGLMCIPPAEGEPRRHFARLRELNARHGAGPHLSMGMSEDFETAIEEGATLLRVGTAIFGARAG
jgi:pyridoxal phosphate enzyme (YggS family)